MLKGEGVAGLSQTSLLLIEDQQHAPFVTSLLQFRQPSGRWLNHATGREDWLGQDSGGKRGGLRIDQLKRGVETGKLAGFWFEADRAAIAIRREHCHHPGLRRTIAAMPTGESQRPRRIRHPVERRVRTDNLESARVLPGDIDRRLIRVGAGLQEHALLQGIGQKLAEPLGQFNLPVVVVAAVGVDQRAARFGDRLRNRRVVVSQPGAHLPRVEVEELLPVDILDFRSGASHEDRT